MENLNTAINEFELEKKNKEHIERAIIAAADKKSQLTTILKNAKQTLEQAHDQKIKLENQIVEATMGQAIESYTKISENYKNLARRCLDLTHRSLASPNMQGV